MPHKSSAICNLAGLEKINNLWTLFLAMVFFLAIAVIDVVNNGLSECMILKNVNVDIFSYLNCLFWWFALTS